MFIAITSFRNKKTHVCKTMTMISNVVAAKRHHWVCRQHNRKWLLQHHVNSWLSIFIWFVFFGFCVISTGSTTSLDSVIPWQVKIPPSTKQTTSPLHYWKVISVCQCRWWRGGTLVSAQLQAGGNIDRHLIQILIPVVMKRKGRGKRHRFVIAKICAYLCLLQL